MSHCSAFEPGLKIAHQREMAIVLSTTSMTSNITDNESVRVLSLNCWYVSHSSPNLVFNFIFFRGLKAVSKHRSQRISAIAQELANSDHDIICLQEVWVHADYELIRAHVSKRLPYAKFHFSGALGAGLPMFSRWPITSTSIHPYSLNGYPLDVTGGDFYVGKSIVSIVIAHPALGEVEVFNTHVSSHHSSHTASRLMSYNRCMLKVESLEKNGNEHTAWLAHCKWPTVFEPLLALGATLSP